jgi:hypothetical protein
MEKNLLVGNGKPNAEAEINKCLIEVHQPPYCIALVSGCPSSQIKIKWTK